jgi:hypothetical protein
MEVADGRYTGQMEFWSYAKAKASHRSCLATGHNAGKTP